MLRAHAVVDVVEPSLQIGVDEVDHRHELFGHFGFAAFGNCMVVEAPLAQAGVAAPIVGDDQRARHDGIPDKATQGIGAAVSSGLSIRGSRRVKEWSARIRDDRAGAVLPARRTHELFGARASFGA